MQNLFDLLVWAAKYPWLFLTSLLVPQPPPCPSHIQLSAARVISMHKHSHSRSLRCGVQSKHRLNLELPQWLLSSPVLAMKVQGTLEGLVCLPLARHGQGLFPPHMLGKASSSLLPFSRSSFPSMPGLSPVNSLL